MKILKYLSIILFLSNCSQSNEETIISNRNNGWNVEIIEEHEFLYRKGYHETIYIHRPKCGSCIKLINIEKKLISDTDSY